MEVVLGRLALIGERIVAGGAAPVGVSNAGHARVTTGHERFDRGEDVSRDTAGLVQQDKVAPTDLSETLEGGDRVASRRNSPHGEPLVPTGRLVLPLVLLGDPTGPWHGLALRERGLLDVAPTALHVGDNATFNLPQGWGGENSETLLRHESGYPPHGPTCRLESVVSWY